MESSNHDIIQRQLQLIMIKKYLKENIYLKKEDRKLLIILVLIE